MSPSLVIDSTYPPLPETARATPIVLGSHPNSPYFLYCNDRYVVMRNIKDPEVCRIYSKHLATTLCARYSPSGNYIASGDAQGKLHIWAPNPDGIIKKYDHQVFSGPVKDVAWAPDNSKLVAVGGAGSTFAHFFRWDSENRISNVSHSTKTINSVDLCPTMPFRCCMASEDQRVHFVTGPKLEQYLEITDNSSFVNCARYTPDGNVFITGGSDSKVFVYGGTDGKLLRALTPPHKGGIYAVAPSPDSRQVLTASGDKTAAIYDIETGQQVQLYKLGTTMEDMQVGCLWEGSNLMTVSLSGYINYLDLNDTSKPIRILHGHKKAYTSSFLSEDSIFMGSYDGRISKYDISSGQSKVIPGNKQLNVSHIIPQSTDTVLSFSVNSSVNAFNSKTLEFSNWTTTLPSQPISVASDGQNVVVGCSENLIFMRGQSVVCTLNVTTPVTCCAISVKVGHIVCAHTNTTVYDIPTDGTLKLKKTLPNLAKVLQFSPDGKYIAAVVFNEVIVMAVPEYENVGRGYFGNSSSILSVAWSPDCKRFMTASVDSSILIWEVGKNRALISVDRAHNGCPLICSFFVSDEKVASLGSDCCLNMWSIK